MTDDTTFKISQLQTSPVFVHLSTIAATLQIADVRVYDAGKYIVVIEFVNEENRAAFLEAVKFVQGGAK